MERMTRALGLINEAFADNEKLREDRPTECFRIEQDLHSVFLNLVLALYNISFNKQLLVVEMFSAGLVDHLAHYLQH
jgi:hypothetical protein